MKTIILVIFCLLGMRLFSAEIYDVKYMGMKEGMTSNYVHDIAQDKTGLMWFATEEGLNRFDGARFFTFYNEGRTGKSISCDELSELLDDSNYPVLWIGTQNDGLNMYDYEKGEFKYYHHETDNLNSISGNCVTDLYASNDGHIWIATSSGGIDRFSYGADSFEHFNTKTVKNLPDNGLWCVLDDWCGSLYAGHMNGGLSVIDIKRKSAVNYRHDEGNINSISGNEVTCLYRDGKGRIWIGTDVGLDIFYPKAKNFVHVSPNRIGKQRIYNIQEFSDGRIWVGTERLGIVVIDPKSLDMANKSGNESCVFINSRSAGYCLNGNDVRCLHEDKFGQIWAGLWEGGVNLLTTVRPLFNLIEPYERGVRDGLTDKSVMGLCFDKSGLLWVGTNSFGLNVFSKVLKRVKTHPLEVGPCVQSIVCDSEGRMWFGSYNGGLFVRFTDGFRQILPNGSEDVRTLYEDGQKQMFVGTSDGVYIVDVKTLKVKRHLRTKNNLVRTIAIDEDKNIWIGTYGGGVEVYSSRFVLKKRYDRKRMDGLMPSDIVTQIIVDSESHIWVATNGGLLRFKSADDSAPVLYDRKSGIGNSHIRAVVEDRHKNIWLSTNKGIYCLTAGQRDAIGFTYIDNVPINNFNDRSVAESKDGILFFGSAGSGICYFDPSLVLKKYPAPGVILTSLYILRGIDKQDSLIFLAGKKEIRLKYNENNLRIGFTTSNFALRNLVEYSYRIDGMQKEWQVTQSDQIVLRDVPYGKYKLLVRARFRNQEWSEAEMFMLDILPPLWLTWWAKLIYCFFIMFGLIWLLKSYRRHLKLKYQLRAEHDAREQEVRLNDERLRFFTNITHELRTPVTLILGPLDDIVHSSGIPVEIKHTLAVCRDSAVKLNKLINQILEFRKVDGNRRQLKVRRGNIVDVVRNIVLKYVKLAQNDELKIHLTTECETIEFWFDKEIVEIVVDNLMSNAVKYTPQGDITVTVKRAARDGRQWVDISVRDTGYGISPQALPHIFERYYQERGAHQASGTGIGLSLVKSLMDIHQGLVGVSSDLGKGTEFTVSLDFSKDYPEALHEQENVEDDIADISVKDDINVMPEVEDEDGAIEKKTLLIVEDNKDLREYVADAFRKEWNVCEANDGVDGLSAAINLSPDVIVSDVMMPNMDGTELCRRVKNDSRTSHILFILLTAKDSIESKTEGYEAGADSYITKPFTNSLLRSRINNLVAQRRRIISQIEGSSADVEEKKRRFKDSLNETDKMFFDRLDEVVAEHIAGELDLGILTQELAMSTSTLYRKIKTLTGLSPNEYIRRYKMRYAERLLLEGRYSIGEIACMVGMNSTAYFRRCFKAEYGMLPSEYLNRLKD